jgi:aspartyl-tRNA(Asn)/glutamyl-tRNA(Gln) amidotransferase subunit C
MSKFTEDDIKKLAKLSRLKLTKAEISKYQKELSSIVEYVERLQAVDLTGLEPTSQVTGLVNVTRADEEIDYKVSPDQLLQNAPKIENHQFKVKRMVG